MIGEGLCHGNTAYIAAISIFSFEIVQKLHVLKINLSAGPISQKHLKYFANIL